MNLRILFSFIAGLIIGFIALAGTVRLLAPSLMLTEHTSRFDTIDATTAALVESIEANGWASPAVRNMNQSMANNGVTMDQPIRIVELCNATHAKRILESNPEVSTLMPCAWGVYYGGDGSVKISGMNMSLMGKLFGGVIQEVMGGQVADEEIAILEPVVVQ